MYDYDSFYVFSQDFLSACGTRDGLGRDDTVLFNLCVLFLDEMDEEEPDFAVCDLLLDTITVVSGMDLITFSAN
jgi:hypothetical protein